MLSLIVVYSGFIIINYEPPCILDNFINEQRRPHHLTEIIIPSKESDEDMVGSSNIEMDISIESDSARVGSVEESFISEEGKENK